VKHKARVCGQPGLHLLALVHPDIIQHDMNRRDVRGHLPIDLLQKGNAFHLAFALGRGGVDRTRARIKTGKEVQGALPSILMFDSDWLARLCGQGRSGARPGLQTGFLVYAQDPFPYSQGAGIQGDKLLELGGKRGIARDPWRQPQMMAPWFQLVMGQNPLNGLGRDRLHNPVVHQLAGQLCTIPLRQGTPNHIRTLAGQLDDIQRDRRGKNWLAAGAFGVVQTVDAIGNKA